MATNFNLDTLRGYTFKGFVQFQEPEGATYFRLKERQTMNLTARYDRVKHYTDDGTLRVDPAGISHSFDMRIKLTTDLIDTVYSTSADKKTISYWMAKNDIHEPIEVIFVATLEHLAGTNDFSHFKFTLDPNTFTPSFGASGGSPEIAISGIVLSIDSVLKKTTDVPPA